MHREMGGNNWESLLRRPCLEAGESPQNTTDSGRTILLTGAGGCIGAALAKVIITSNPRLVILLDHSELNLHQIQTELAAIAGRVPPIAILGDVCDGALLTDIFATYRPEIIYHAAAFKHVPLMETNPIAAVRNNSMGTGLLAELAVKYEATSLLLISTDKAVNPHSVMGASKRVAELVLLRWTGPRTQMKVVRLGNVLGSPGSVVPLFLQQISRGGPVTVTHPDISRYFLTLSEAVELVLAAASLEGGGSIFIPGLGCPVKILDLATHLIRTAGFEPEKDIPIVFTGLRAGDKMVEELASAHESPEPTSDGRLHRASSLKMSPDGFDAAMRELAVSVCQRDVASLLEALCRMVPEYRPSDTVLGFRKRSPA